MPGATTDTDGTKTGPGEVYHRVFPAGEIKLAAAGRYMVWICPGGAPSAVASHVPSEGETAVELVYWSDQAVGEVAYTDRGYAFSTLGDYAEGCYYVRGKNSEVMNTPFTDVQWSIKAPWPSTVYLSMYQDQDDDIYGFAKWFERSLWTLESGFTGVKVQSTGPGNVYSRMYDAAELIELFGNDGNGRGTYLVFVCPREVSDETELPALAPDQVLGSAAATSKAECPHGSYAVACTTFPEQVAYSHLPSSTGCRTSSNDMTATIATCSFAGAVVS